MFIFQIYLSGYKSSKCHCPLKVILHAKFKSNNLSCVALMEGCSLLKCHLYMYCTMVMFSKLLLNHYTTEFSLFLAGPDTQGESQRYKMKNVFAEYLSDEVSLSVGMSAMRSVLAFGPLDIAFSNCISVTQGFTSAIAHRSAE